VRKKCELPEMRRKFDAGWSPLEISLSHGVTPGYVRELLNFASPGCVIAKSNERQAAAWKQKSADEIVLRVFKGEPLRKIAHEVGMTYGAVWHLARRNGMRRRTEMKHERAKAMARRHARGDTQRQIAAVFGVTQVCVSKAIRRVKQREAV
jgi:transposase